MADELNDKKPEEYQFIQETIVSKKKSKLLRRIGTAVFVVVLAVVFGLVAGIVFFVTSDVLKEKLGTADPGRQQVELPKTTPIPTKTPTPEITRTLVDITTPTPQTQAQQGNPSDFPAKPSEIPAGPAKPTAEPTATQGAEVTEPAVGTMIPELTKEPETGSEQVPADPSDIDLTPTEGVESGQEKDPSDEGEKEPNAGTVPSLDYSYVVWMDQIMKLKEQAKKSLVSIDAVVQGVDWFQETFETKTKATGLVLANDGVDLLILADSQRVGGANQITVTFFDKKTADGRVYTIDEDYGLAVVAVALTELSEELLGELKTALITDLEEVATGLPVLALGAPNGYEDSMEFGMITSLGGLLPITDGQLPYVTTNMTDHANGHGFVYGLDGKVIGMITHTKKMNPEDGIASVQALGTLKPRIVKLLNNLPHLYLGVKGQDVPNVVATVANVDYGVYIREVESTSPALAAGIKNGDILLEIGGVQLEGMDALTEYLLSKNNREVVSAKLLRMQGDGLKELTVDIVLIRKE